SADAEVSEKISTIFHNALNLPVQVPVSPGFRWEVSLDLSDPETMQYVAGKLIGAYYDAVVEVLLKAEISFNPQTILGAVTDLAMSGVNFDTFMVQQIEKIEQDRRDGLLPARVSVGG